VTLLERIQGAVLHHIRGDLVSTFDSTERLLPDVLKDIVKGKIQLPDFQRGWIWDDEHVRSLLISIARSFPVGAVMLLEAGGAARFQVRPTENVPFVGALPEPESLVLDGQQRLASPLSRGPVKTSDEKGKPIERFYYFHIPSALDAEQDRALRMAAGQSRVRIHYHTKSSTHELGRRRPARITANATKAHARA
jgi:hypothetical protein